MTEEKVRVVPNGKVYRQLFEAQAWLHHQLIKPKSQSATVVRKGLPIINREATEHDLLNSRQKSWLNGLPFDIYTENPVLYKQYANYIQAQNERNQSPAEKSLVQALPEEVVTRQQYSSNVVERIENSRRMRHEAALEEFSHELTLIASKLEYHIEQASQRLTLQLEEDDAEIEILLSSIETDEDILQFNYQRLENLWYKVQEHLPKRESYIKHLDEKFNQVEEMRLTQVKELFLKYFEIFETISYKTKSETKRMMDNIAQMVNQTLLSNKMNYMNIYVKLMIINMEREKKQHAYWKERVQFWKDVNIKRFIEQFREYINSPEVINPPIIGKLKEKMVLEHTQLNDQYKQLLNALRELHPPKCLPTLLQQWYEQTQFVSRGMYDAAGTYVLELEKAHEGCIDKYMEKLEETKVLLIMNQFCSTERATTLKTEFLPTIKSYEMKFKLAMSELKMEIDMEFKRTDHFIMDIFRFLQSLAKLWKSHETGLGKQEQTLHESLQDHRVWHNEQNQKREDKLDSILDEMRQGANEVVLNSLLNQTKTLLTNIHISYQEFYTEQVKIVKTYPDMVTKQLEYYEENVCTFFKLKKEDIPEEELPQEDDRDEFRQTASQYGSTTSAMNENTDEDTDTQKTSDVSEEPQVSTEQNESPRVPSKSSQSSESGSSKSVGLKKVSPTEDDFEKQGEKDDSHTSPRNSVPEPQIEAPTACYLFTDAGTRYLCLLEEEGKESATEKEDVNENVKHLHISDEFIFDIKLQIRANFLNHLDTWLVEAKSNSNHATTAKIEELDAEFNLRIQLHLPRAKRIEQDVYNVRAGELLLHSGRVAEHCQGVEKALSELKSRFLLIKQQQEKMMGEFHNEIELMEPAFLNITKSGRLITLRNQMSKQIQKLMVNIRTNLRVFRVQLDQDLQTVRGSNASLVQNFKLFSDGGNFCPEEVNEFQKAIEELSTIIDDNECQILVEMEGMEADGFDQASRITIEFEDRFKNHIFDLLFMETVARSLTNTQVQIKTQVAKNNTSSKELSSFLSELKEKISICEQPNPDLTKVDPSEIAKLFANSLERISARAKYLKCMKTSEAVVTVAPNQAAFASEVPSVCKPGKTMLDDSSVGMIKSILRSQKIPEAIEESSESTSTEEDTSPTSNQENGNEISPTAKARKKYKHSVQKSPSRIYKRHITFNHVTKTVKLKLNFGEEEEKDEEEQEVEEQQLDFLEIIKQLVQHTFISVGAIADDFYRQKGSRPITRPQVLQDTYENCAETLGDKLVSYYNQTKEYIQRCHAEFHSQLEELENLAKKIPPLLFRSLLEQHLCKLDEGFSQWEYNFQEAVKHLEQEQKRHQHLLQPNLGHPQKASQLQKLNEEEINRHEQFNKEIEKHFQDLQKVCIKCSELFLQELIKLSEKLLLQFDELLVSSEVLPGKNDVFKAKQDVKTTESEKPKTVSEKKRGIWPGVSLIELYTKTSLKSPFPRKTSPSITTIKNTLPQQSTFQSRNDTFQIYVGSFERRIASIEKRKKTLLHGEERWFENWKTSLENIQQLFI